MDINIDYSALSVFDFMVVGICLISIIFGLFKGLVKSVISLITLFFLFLMSFYINPYIVGYVSKYIENEIILSISSYFLSFIISLITTSLLYSQLTKLVWPIAGGIIDRLFGIVFGAVRGLLLSIILFIFSVIITTDNITDYATIRDLYDNISEDKYPAWLKKSVSYSILSNSSHVIHKVINPDLIEKYIMDIKLFNIDKNKKLKDSLKKKVTPKIDNSKDNYFGEIIGGLQEEKE